MEPKSSSPNIRTNDVFGGSNSGEDNNPTSSDESYRITLEDLVDYEEYVPKRFTKPLQRMSTEHILNYLNFNPYVEYPDYFSDSDSSLLSGFSDLYSGYYDYYYSSSTSNRNTKSKTPTEKSNSSPSTSKTNNTSLYSPSIENSTTKAHLVNRTCETIIISDSLNNDSPNKPSGVNKLMP